MRWFGNQSRSGVPPDSPLLKQLAGAAAPGGGIDEEVLGRAVFVEPGHEHAALGVVFPLQLEHGFLDLRTAVEADSEPRGRQTGLIPKVFSAGAIGAFAE